MKETAQKPQQPSYCIGSGWWCSNEDEAVVNPNRKLLGAPSVRAVSFFDIWRESINRNTNPASIVVVDSRSPVKPPEDQRAPFAWVELPFNAKHSVDHLGKWSGWTRSVLVAGQYALASEADYFVYVEQDCLLAGKGIIEHCIQSMDKGIMFGSGDGTPQPLQQSFFIIRRDRLAPFLKNLADIKADDRDFSPEWKFVCATWRPLITLARLKIPNARAARLLAFAIARRFFIDWLPIGTGRSRPLPMTKPYWYFQHGSDTEVATYLEAEGASKPASSKS